MTSSAPVAITCQQLTKAYDSRQGRVHALRELDFSVQEKEFVSIVGPSGCGKTTLLKILAGLLKPTSGWVRYYRPRRNGRPHVVMVFQENGLYPWMSVLDNVAFALETRGVRRSERRARAQAFVERVGLAAFAKNYPHELSAGMRQRVGLARAFLAQPDILLMDEPFGALDAQTRLVMQAELLRLWRENQQTVVYVTHDIEEAIILGDRVLVMTGHPGQIRDDLSVPLSRPRDLAGHLTDTLPEIADLRWQIWKMLKEEVQQNLKIVH